MDSEIIFEPFEHTSSGNVGILSIPLSARIVINDGQHRRAAIEEALKQAPHLGTETMSVVFFQDLNLERSQQMFADLNRHAAKPTKSLGILYDHRDPLAQVARSLVDNTPTFKDLTETERTTISNRSTKLFTLNSIYQATDVFLRRATIDPSAYEACDLASTFWTALGSSIPEWERARLRDVSPASLRSKFVHVHGVTLQALGRVGGDLIAAYPDNWKEQLVRLSDLDWSRGNLELWDGRALVGGRITKGQHNVVLIGNAIKNVMQLSLDSEEQRIESQYGKGRPFQQEVLL